MIFSELYSVYYNTVSKIISAAFQKGVTEKDLQKCVAENAFSESVLTILPALKSGKWPLLNKDLTPVLKHIPSAPLTLLEKQWLKAVASDPRVKLFDAEFPELNGVEPLFTQDDYRIYDRYSDGDPFEDEEYIRHFRLILSAIKQHRSVSITVENRFGKPMNVDFYPKGFEYSVKDDKIRIIADGCKYSRFNMARVRDCCFCAENTELSESPAAPALKELTLLITDEYNALERAMLHFAHFEKRAERLKDGKYILRLKYRENDEIELVIRVLSFGPYIKVTEPDDFVNLIKERLILQKSCGLI